MTNFLSLDLMFLALAAYWSFAHVSQPFIHRGTFEAAFSGDGQKSGDYGPDPPLALLHAIAVNGLRFVELPGITDHDRLLLSRSWCGKARDFLASRYYTKNRMMSDLEAAQTLMLLFNRLVSEMIEPSPFIYVERCSEIMPRLIREPHSEDFVGLKPPDTHAEWIHVEQVIRLFIQFQAADYGYQYLIDRRPLMDHFNRISIPAHDSLFDLPSSRDAFNALQLLHPTGNVWMQVDLSPPLSIQADDGFLGRQIQALLGPMWTRLSSSLASTYCLSFLRHMRGRMREFASQHGVDPISLASQPPELDTEYDRLYRKHVAVITSMVSVMISSMQIGRAHV